MSSSRRDPSRVFTPARCAFALALSVCSLPALANPPLVDAARRGDHDAVRTLLTTGGDVNAREADGATALHWAVLADDGESVRLLLRAGAQVNAANRYGVTPLEVAATTGDLAIVEALLARGADANATLPEGETVLMSAARTGNAEAVRLLLDYGADASAREHWYGETALIWAAAGNFGSAVRTLAAYGADMDGRSAPLNNRRGGQSGSWTPLMYAARQGALDSIAALLDSGASIDAADPDGATPLQLAIVNAHWDAVALLLARGADPDRADKTGMTPLYAAVDTASLPAPFGRPDHAPTGPPDVNGVVRMLLDEGANPDAPLKVPILQRLHTLSDASLGAGATPFMRAAKSGNVALMRLLLDYGANPALTQANHTTALMVAAGLGWRDGFPTKPPFVAIRDSGTDQGAIEAIKICLEHGADVNAVNDDGETALHGAADARGSQAIVRFLVSSGARLDMHNTAGLTPLDAAFAHRDRAGTLLRTDIVAELRQLAARHEP